MGALGPYHIHMYPWPSLPAKPLSRGGIPLGETEKYRGLDGRGITVCEEFPPPGGVRPHALKQQPASTVHWGVKQTPQAATICLSKACPKPPMHPNHPEPPLPATALKWGAYRLVDDARPGRVGSSYSLACWLPSTIWPETWEQDVKLTTSTPPPRQLLHSNGAPTAWLMTRALDAWALPMAWFTNCPAPRVQQPGSEMQSRQRRDSFSHKPKPPCPNRTKV